MRSITSFVVVLCLGFALAVPAPKKLEKKSISESLAPKAIEPVDQKLDEPKLSDEALMETAGENVDRAKKQASTTFCVEIRQNKPTQVDCDELHSRPMPPPPPPSAPIFEPQEPVPEPPRPQIVHQLQPAQPEFKFELPCEPEIAAYYTQPAGEIVYAPTGNCAQQVPANIPTLVHVPSAPYGHSPFYNVPAGGSGAPGMHVLHLPSTGGLGGHGLFPLHTTGGSSIHLQPGSLLPSGGSGSLLPLHQAGGPGGFAPSTSVSAGVHMIQPSIVAPILPQHSHHGSGFPGIGSGGVNLHVHGGLPSAGSGTGGVPHTHGVQLSGVECTCKSTEQGTILAKSSGGDGSPSNEALAMKFLQDLQRNAGQRSSSSSPVMITSGSGMPLMSGDGSAPTMRMSSGSPSGSVGINSGTPTITMSMPSGASPIMQAKSALLQKLQGRGYMRPVMQEQVVYRPAGINGLHGLPFRGVPMVYTSGGYPSGIIRSQSNDPCLEDSFQTLPMAQGLRLSRDEEGSDKKSSQESKSSNKDEVNTSTSGTLDQLKNNPTFDPKNSDDKDKPKNSDRVARFLMNDDVSASNRLDAE